MFILPSDLTAFATIDEAKALAMIEDAEAMATLAAPCLSDPSFLDDAAKVSVVKAILRGAILRWDEAGAGALSQHSQTAGPFTNSESYDTRTQRRVMFWPSEISQLRDLCSAGDDNAAYVIDTAPRGSSVHLGWCALMLGAAYCSCGVDVAGFPIFEGAP